MNKHNKYGFGLIEVLVGLLVVLLIGGAVWYVAARQDEQSPANSTKQQTNSQKEVIMTVTYSGGLCPDNKICTSESNLYSDGTFENHSKLSESELGKLKQVITATDFTAYQKEATPGCPSAYDGRDQILAFPQKYPDTTFKTCELDIPTDDPALSYINELILSHEVD